MGSGRRCRSIDRRQRLWPDGGAQTHSPRFYAHLNMAPDATAEIPNAHQKRALFHRDRHSGAGRHAIRGGQNAGAWPTLRVCGDLGNPVAGRVDRCLRGSALSVSRTGAVDYRAIFRGVILSIAVQAAALCWLRRHVANRRPKRGGGYSFLRTFPLSKVPSMAANNTVTIFA